MKKIAQAVIVSFLTIHIVLYATTILPSNLVYRHLEPEGGWGMAVLFFPWIIMISFPFGLAVAVFLSNMLIRKFAQLKRLAIIQPMALVLAFIATNIAGEIYIQNLYTRLGIYIASYCGLFFLLTILTNRNLKVTS